ncbi:hypothetical protein KIH39_21980 [Telmatocola sphagniphila]|uniref:Uncharacterized protein n=1 Tax=Telmatocola sphagniphila TaxID=1123043 RepID=A0A8E6B517_9BACT|nr:hypothetical protein [Telmatocola sphagniphila]QVL31487.1 hypothetical protein KIH39_21980 [Telmatocola sphagniphila]
MLNEAFDWMTRIKAVEREYGAIRFVTDRLLEEMTVNPAILGNRIIRRDIVTASSHLEGTYIVRIFSEFETALQHFIRAFHIRKPRGTEPLINRVRDRCRIPQADAEAVHKVREYRNILVHERTKFVVPVDMREATRVLCIFLSRVQGIW